MFSNITLTTEYQNSLPNCYSYRLKIYLNLLVLQFVCVKCGKRVNICSLLRRGNTEISEHQEYKLEGKHFSHESIPVGKTLLCKNTLQS